MSLFNNFVLPAVAFVLMGVVRLLVTLIVLVAAGLTSVVRPLGVDPAFLVRSSVTKSDENNNKETLSGVQMATTTTAHEPGPEELVDLARPITPLSIDVRELELRRREKDVSYLNKAVSKYAKKVEQQERDLFDQFERLRSVDKEEARLARFRDQLEGRLDEILKPHLEIEHAKQRRLEKYIAQLEFDKAQLKQDLRVADLRSSVCERRLTEQKRENAKIFAANEVEKDLVWREVELVRRAQEEKDCKAKELEGKLARAISTISKLKEKAKIATKCYGQLKEQCDKYRNGQFAVVQSLELGALPDADDDNPICGAYDDPEASHVAALRGVGRQHAVQETRADRDLCNLTLTMKEDTAKQTDAHASADNELPVLADGSVVVSAERYEAAMIQYQEYQELLSTVPSLQEKLKQLEAKLSEQARLEFLQTELNLAQGKHLEALEHIQSLQPSAEKYLKALKHIKSLQPSAGALQMMAGEANTAFEEVMKAYQDPNKHMQFVTLLAPGSDLEGNLNDLRITADVVVDGLKQTDDGMEFANEEAAVHQLLGLQN